MCFLEGSRGLRAFRVSRAFREKKETKAIREKWAKVLRYWVIIPIQLR